MIYKLTLYITGRTYSSECAAENLRRILEKECPGAYEITIVDVVERPEEAETHRVLATPTLIKESPPPVRRIVGDMSDTCKVLLGLGLNSANAKEVNQR
ncbi:MAG TPA: circadian clock KaiB family protein [Candidatus Angelobacter sp.]|nr:circadian clock KaiB family protein [Candidatus Angelobacter sp.]